MLEGQWEPFFPTARLRVCWRGKDPCKRLKREKGTYDAYLIPEGIEDYSYTKDGKEIRGSQYKVRLEFPKRKK